MSALHDPGDQQCHTEYCPSCGIAYIRVRNSNKSESETLTNVHAISPHTPGQVTTNRKLSHKSPLIVRNIQTKLTVHSKALKRAHLVNLTVCAITHHFNELKYASWILRRKEVCTTIYFLTEQCVWESVCISSALWSQLATLHTHLCRNAVSFSTPHPKTGSPITDL